MGEKENWQSVKKLLTVIALTGALTYYFILGVLISHTLTIDFLPSKTHKVVVYIEW